MTTTAPPPTRKTPNREAPPPEPHNPSPAPLRCVDLFCGIGGFHQAAANLGLEVVFACDIDPEAAKAYQTNYKLPPQGDIAAIPSHDIPDHHLLFAGFPCQPFSIIGQRKGLSDPRGTLFFEALRIIRDKQPQGIILENVKQLATAQQGSVLAAILQSLRDLGYSVDHRILNALHFGLPQKRERAIIVATRNNAPFPWPTQQTPMTPLKNLLEENPHPRHYVSDYIRRSKTHTQTLPSPAIWHENKGGHISSHPWSCALRAGASYNYLLIDGKRRPTPRELLRLQGFPDSFRIVCNDSQTRKQAGNAVPVPLAQAIIQRIAHAIDQIGQPNQPQTPKRRSATRQPLPPGADS